MKNKSTILLACILLFQVLNAGCNLFRNKKGPVDGGPCSYEIKIYPAIVLEVYSTGAGQFDAEFMIIQDSERISDEDTLYYSAEFTMPLYQRDLDSLGVYKGARFTYEVSNILTGHCSPHLERLRMEPFTD